MLYKLVGPQIPRFKVETRIHFSTFIYSSKFEIMLLIYDI